MNLALLLALLLSTALPDDAARIRAAAEQALAVRFPAAMERVEIRLKTQPKFVETGAALRIEFSGETLPRGTTQATVFAGSDAAGWQKLGRVLLYVAHFDSVLVARQDVARDDSVTPYSLSSIWIETTTFAGEPLTPEVWRTLSKNSEVFATRMLREGRPLRPSDLRPAYAAEPGESVVMRYRRGALVLDIPCTARQRGYRGDVVRLYAASTGRTYRARLGADGTATWVETL